MTQNHQSSIENRQSDKPKRQRLTPKQRQFLHLVYDLNISILDALIKLRIRVVTFERWLNKPVFIDRLRMYITQYYLQARLEMARGANEAVSVLSQLTAASRHDADARKACTDILNFHTQYARIVSSKQAQNGAPLDNFGALLAQFGASLAQNGACLTNAGDSKTPKNRVFDAKNNENHKNPHLIPSAASSSPGSVTVCEK